MAHLTVPDSTATVSVTCFDSASTGVAMHPPPWDQDSYLANGAIRGWGQGRYRAHYIQSQHLLHLMDLESGCALYWTQNRKFVPWWEQTFPFRQLIHWGMEKRALQPVHAGAVGFADGGVLLAGKSGSGKSTSTLSCLHSPLLYAGDDYVLLDHEGEEPWVHSLYATAKVVPDNLHRLPWLRDWVVNPEELGEQKAVVYVNEQAAERVSRGFPIRAILLPRVTGEKRTRIVPATAGEAMQALAPTSVFHLNGDSMGIMRKVSRVVRAVPAYWLEAGTELEQIPDAICGLLGRRA
ncbi:hypothetical protein [Bryobacter aggregatus]|uniref:hypothetical protein n=1 Tax=Bryobacter aggregatus TaxID=360054 RepID=UPI0012BA7511|nr:hypothetical protein [Bryobacter aggregatus]